MTISAAPEFVLHPTNQQAKIGQDFVSFECIASGNPTPHITWLHNDEKILLDDRTTMHHNGTIVIQHIEESDEGFYTCTATNVNGRITSTANLEILRKILLRFIYVYIVYVFIKMKELLLPT